MEGHKLIRKPEFQYSFSQVLFMFSVKPNKMHYHMLLRRAYLVKCGVVWFYMIIVQGSTLKLVVMWRRTEMFVSVWTFNFMNQFVQTWSLYRCSLDLLYYSLVLYRMMVTFTRKPKCSRVCYIIEKTNLTCWSLPSLFVMEHSASTVVLYLLWSLAIFPALY